MRVSEAWLREWVNPQIDTNTLVSQLAMAGLEVDAVEAVAGAFTQVVVGEIVAAERHPDAEKLQVCRVNIGAAEPLQIVCGAANARPGIRVPCACVGAELPGDIKIKRAKLRGVESFGMLCSVAELGLAESADGLFELPADAPIGQDIRAYMRLDDVSLDVDLTPNRGDCLGVAGLAREISVINRANLTIPEIVEIGATTTRTFPIRLKAGRACPRYVGRVVEGVNVNVPSPLWLKEKLRRAGVRSIDPVVDVTNLVMLELGQPMHAFDLDTLQGAIEVRHAKAGEEIVLLDGQTLRLAEDDLLIVDEQRPLALAGIMGGELSGVSAKTRTIFFESAWFDQVMLAGKARRYGLHTDASHRFERGVDYQLQRRAVERATELLLAITGGQPGPTTEAVLADQLPHIEPIVLRRSRIARLLGLEIPDATVEDILERLGMDVSALDDGWHVVPPSFRFDVRIEADLIEELGRIWGYERLPVRVPSLPFAPPMQSERVVSLERAKHLLIDRGYQEVITYSFVDAKYVAALTPGEDACVLSNPISADMSHMRTSIWAGLLKTAEYNLNRQQTRLRLFESGLIFRQNAGELVQTVMLGGLIYGAAEAEAWANDRNRQADFFDLKADVEALLSLTASAVEFEPCEHSALHPGQRAAILREGQRIGVLGALHPSLQNQLGFAKPVFLFELEVPALQRELPQFRELSRFPGVRRDLAVIVDENTPTLSILKIVREVAGEWLTQLTLFDVFQGGRMEPGRKSVAFGVVLQHSARTLRDDEVASVMSQITGALQKEFNVILRE
ncbi:Phenylalanyl-tRNA synthetase beta chain [gamma proteobacterium HdN1]|nr:Phenylalanyl-tRNA synthetase beta chain [gamma proteobacterium HdN1]